MKSKKINNLLNIKTRKNKKKYLKKIAISMSGKLSTFNKTYKDFYKNIVDVLKDKFEVDIFMFIWKSENKEDIEKAIEIYKPKKYIIKDDFEFKLPYFCENMYFYKGFLHDITKNFGNGIYMHYGIKECFNLIDNNYYDYVIRNRYDNLFQEKIDITTFNNNIYIPTGHYFYLNGNPTNMNDSFAYGPYNLMKKYSNFINTYKDILLQIKNRELTGHYSYLYKAITPTLLFKYYISGIEKILYSEIEINYGLLRNNNSLTKFVNNQHYIYEGMLYKINDEYYEFVTFILWKSNKNLQKNIINNFKEYEITIDTFNYNKEKRYNLMSQIYYPIEINSHDPRIHYNDTITLITIKYYKPDYKYIYRSKKYHPCINSIINYKLELRKKFTALDFHVSDFLNESNVCLLSLKNISPEFIIIDYNNLYGICHNGKTTDESRSGNFSFINVKNSYNYKYLLGDKESYCNYCKKSLGHSIEKYDNLIKNFNVETYNNFNQITVYQYGNNYIINDGLHRASLLYSLGYRHITAKIIKKPYDWYVFNFEINTNILDKENSNNEIYYNLVNNLSKNSIEFEIEHNSYYDKTFYVKNNNYEKYLNNFLIKNKIYITNSKKFIGEKPYYIKFEAISNKGKINTHKDCYNHILNIFNKNNIKFVIIRGFKFLPLKPDTDLDIIIHPNSYNKFIEIYSKLKNDNLIRIQPSEKYIENNKQLFYTVLFTSNQLKEGEHLPGNYYRFDTYSDLFFYKDGEGKGKNAIICNQLFKKYLFDNLIKIDNYYIPNPISEIILLIYRNLYDKQSNWSIKHINRINELLSFVNKDEFNKICIYCFTSEQNIYEYLTAKKFNKINKPTQKLNLFIIRKKGMKQEIIENILNQIENKYQILDKILININNKKKFYSNFYGNYDKYKDNIEKNNDNQCLAIITNNPDNLNPNELKQEIRKQYINFYPPLGNIIHSSDSYIDCEKELELLFNENIDNFNNIGTYYSQVIL